MKPATLAQAKRWARPAQETPGQVAAAFLEALGNPQPAQVRPQVPGPIAHPAPVDPAMLGEKTFWDVGF